MRFSCADGRQSNDDDDRSEHNVYDHDNGADHNQHNGYDHHHEAHHNQHNGYDHHHNAHHNQHNDRDERRQCPAHLPSREHDSDAVALDHRKLGPGSQ